MLVTYWLWRSKEEPCYQSKPLWMGSRAPEELLVTLPRGGLSRGCQVGKEIRLKPSKAFGLGAQAANSEGKGRGGLMNDLEPGERTRSPLPPTSTCPGNPQFLIPGCSTLWGSISYLWRPIRAYHLIYLQKATHVFRAWTPASCLKSFLWGSRVTILSQCRKKGKAHPTCFHSYHWSNFSERPVSKLPRNC